MEIIIVICLLLIIYLLIQDKIISNKRLDKKNVQKKVNPELPDIMGQPKSVERQSLSNSAIESRIEELEINRANLDIECYENEAIGIQIAQEELEDVFKAEPNWKEEEEELRKSRLSSENNGFAQGVTIEELSSVRVLLQKNTLEDFQKEIAVAIVQKIQGTELFSLLENSMEGASQKIAKLLDKKLSFETKSSSSSLRNDNLEDFNIEDFV